jgi:DNA adenine methylase
MSTYLEVKHRVEKVVPELRKLRANRRQYDKLRATLPISLTAPARAARFIYLNRFCFNGLYRTNLEGKFNVPYSGDSCGPLPTTEHLISCSTVLKRARLLNEDFEEILHLAERGDLIYMDPPFAIRARRVFREYGPSAFIDKDISRLRSCMEQLARARISFVVSYAESDEADRLKKGFAYQTIAVRRNIAGFAAHRAWTNEVLISNS